MDDSWATCVHCGEPRRNHVFGFCEGDQSFASLEDAIAQATKETIVAAACRLPAALGEYMLTVSLPAPARHHDILHAVYRIKDEQLVGSKEQGFLTSKGRYVSREQAWEIVVAAGQPLIPRDGQGGRLYSEDLW